MLGRLSYWNGMRPPPPLPAANLRLANNLTEEIYDNIKQFFQPRRPKSATTAMPWTTLAGDLQFISSHSTSSS
jgi:hypothetical protein